MQIIRDAHRVRSVQSQTGTGNRLLQRSVAFRKRDRRLVNSLEDTDAVIGKRNWRPEYGRQQRYQYNSFHD
jgi:hypothetical protein